jgi:hypothetical protein
VVLPRQQREWLARVLTLAVAKDLFEEVDDTLVLGLPLFAEITPRGV